MSLNYIEDYANAALHSLDPNIKFQAEAAFKEILQSLTVQQYPHVLENYSQNVAFVFLLLLSKNLPKSPEIIDIFKQLQEIAQKWYLPNGQFRRPNDSNYLPYHFVNTLGNTIGICMNRIYIGEKSKNQLVAFLQNHTNQLFKLFLYNHFIEAISIIDDQIQFIHYKRVIESFQQKMIPIILQQLYPYFISVTDKIKINELSSMLPTLNQNTINHKFDLFRPEDKMVSQLVFNLLKEVVSFKYNITFSQYDFEGESEYFLITFPQSILSVLSSKQFLEAFYFMLEKIVSMDYNGSNFETSFECLKKILQSKFSNFKKEQKAQLIHLHYVGLFRLIKANITSQKTLQKVLECIAKFIHTFGLSELQKNHQNHIEFSSAIKQKAIMIVNVTELSSDNRLFTMTSEVICKIAKESIDMSQQKYIQFYKNLCRDFYHRFIESYITKDFIIMGKSNVQKISGLAQLLEDFFKPINNIGGMDMGFMFGLLNSNYSDVFKSQNPTKISNFLFLVTYLVDEDFFDRNIIYQVTPNDQLQILGKLICHCFQFMDWYKKSSLKDKMIDVAILLFLQKILNECLSNLGNNDEMIIISSKTYEVMKRSNQIVVQDEAFLMFCFDELQQSLNTRDYEKVQYVLQALYINLLKLKHTLRRQSFVQTIISKKILDNTIEMSRSSLQESIELLRQRRKLYKIITILSFDDLLDSYRSNIDYVVQQLSQDFREQKYAKIVFDMSGICQNIQTSSIYRYFLTRINATLGIQNLIKTLYAYFGKDGIMLEEVVYLNYTLLCDKSLRMSQKQLSILIYEVIDYSLHYLAQVLDLVRNGHGSDLLNQVLKLANLILEASYINLFLIKRKCQEKLIAFLYKLIDNVLVNYEWARQYPELLDTIHENIQLVLTNASETIITWNWTLENKQQQIQFINKFIQLIQFTMDLCIHTLESAANSGKKYFLSETIIETISKFFSFMRYKRNFIHRQNLIQTIENIKIQNEVHSIKFMQGLYKVSMTNIKNISKAFNAICICIMELTYFYPKAYQNIFISLGISLEIIQKNERIFKKIQHGKQDNLFVSNLKEWLCKKESHYDVEISDY